MVQKMNKYGIKSVGVYEVVLFIIMSLMLLNIVFINVFKLDDFLNSDIVAEMSYIKTVCEQKSILPFDWVNSQELFINRPVYIAVPLYLITGNLMLSYQITIIITTILILVAFAYFLKQLNVQKAGILIGLICILGLYCNEITRILFVFLNAYALFPITIFLTFGFYIQNNIKRETIKDKSLKIIVLFLLAFIMGASGPRMTIVLYLPIFMVEILNYMREVWKNKELRIKYTFEYSGLSLVIVNAIGYLTYIIFIRKFIEHNDISNLRILPVKRIIQGIPDLIATLFNAVGIYGDTGLMSATGIDFIIKSVVLVISLCMLYYVIKNRNKEIRETIIFFVLSLNLVIIYTLLTSEIFSERYYFLVPFFLVTILVLGIQNLSMTNKIFEIGTITIILVAVMSNLFINYMPLYRVNGNVEQKQIVDYLVKNNFKIAYGTYWNSDVLKGLSNAQIETGHFAGEGFNPYLWLTNKSLYQENGSKEKIAIILTDEEEHNVLELNNYDSFTLENMNKDMEIGEYNIYSTYNNPVVNTNLPRKKGEVVLYDFTKRYVLRNDENVSINYKERYIESNKNGGTLVWGPYINTKPGTYSFKLNYEVMESTEEEIGYFELVLNEEVVQKGTCNLVNTNTAEIIKDIQFENDTDVLQYRIHVKPGTIIRLNSIEVTKED